MSSPQDYENHLISAFEMWGKYHEPVTLIHRSFTIIAVNEACKATGQVVTGQKCNATNPELHKGCKAMEALKTNEPKMTVSERDGIIWTSFWIPVSGVPDYYIHFTNGFSEYMEKLSNSN